MRRYRSFSIQVMVAMVLLVAVVSCATFKQNTYNSLFLAGSTYDAVMSIAGDVYKQGKLTVAQKDEIIKYATPFYSAYHAAVDAFDVWNKTQLSTDKDKMLVAFTAMASKASALKDYLNRLGVKDFDGVLDKLNQLNELAEKLK